MARNYDLMRTMLVRAHLSKGEPVKYSEIASGYSDDDIQEELDRLVEEGLIEHNITFENDICFGGSITSISKNGHMFARNLCDRKVWLLLLETLNKADLDLTYPLLKEVCDEIIRRYVMQCIPEKLI